MAGEDPAQPAQLSQTLFLFSPQPNKDESKQAVSLAGISNGHDTNPHLATFLEPADLRHAVTNPTEPEGVT